MTRLDDLLDRCRSERLFSGATYVVGDRRRVLAEGAIGSTAWDDGKPVDVDTLFDIASITKPIVALQILLLIDEGALGLTDTIAERLDEYAGTDKADITIGELLTHSSGISGQQPLYLTCPTRSELLGALRFLPLRFQRGQDVEYTSQGFMILGEIVERVTGERLDRLLDKSVFRRLGMDSTLFCPPAALEPRIAATENCPWRGRVVKGSVHDENAAVLGGIAGHAGLFSSAKDLGRLGRVMLGRGELDGTKVFSRSMLDEMTKPRTEQLRLRRCYGWQGADPLDCPVGEAVSATSYGHTGFTGTSLWIDPSRDRYFVLLTNAVHPRRRPESLKQVRPRFHQLALEVAAR